MIMEVGKFCPAYGSFGHLFPDSAELQSALCGYYASVIRLCARVIVVLRRPAVSHAFSSLVSPFESEFSDQIAQLREDAKLVKLQTTYAANKAAIQAEKLAAEERKSNKKLRFNIKKEQIEAQEWRLRQSRREVSQLRDVIRDRLSTLDSLKAYKRVLQQRVSGTAGWILKDDAFCQWRGDRDSAVLWCSGKMGSGKTVLMSTMVEHLHVLRQPTELIAHHFCFSDHHASLEVRNILGSIAKQLLEGWAQSASMDQLRALHRELLDATSVDITRIISNRLLSDQSCYIMLDGIDECETDEARELLKGLSELSRKHRNIKIALASRLEVNKILRQKFVIKYNIQALEMKTRTDMRCYIDAILNQRLKDKELVLDQPTIILKISDKLEQDSEGMFLWVRLFVDDLCEQQCDNDILAALQGPPPSISRLIDRKMNRIQERASSKNVLKLLQFCGVLKRPLTILEYRELFSLNTNQVSRDAGQMVHNVCEVVADAGGLIYVDEEEQTVHYVHQNVRNHLFESTSTHGRFAAATLDLHLGFVVLTYLNFSDFQRSLVKADTGSSLSFRPIDMIASSLADWDSYAARAAQKLLQSRTSLKQLKGKELEHRIRETLGTLDQSYDQLETQYPFLVYVKSYWLDHLEQIDLGSDKRMWSLFRKLVEGENGLIDTPWKRGLKVHPSTHPSSSDTAQVIDWALAKQKPALVMYELVQNRGLIRESDQQHILNSATPSNLSRLMSVLICQQIPRSGLIYTAVTRAAALGLPGCIDMGIRQGFDPNWRPDPNSPTPIQTAAGGGHLEVVERLITAKADVNAATTLYGRTALQAAAGGGHLNIIKRLKNAGARQ